MAVGRITVIRSNVGRMSEAYSAEVANCGTMAEGAALFRPTIPPEWRRVACHRRSKAFALSISRTTRRGRSVISDCIYRNTAMPDGPRYEDDFYAWTQYQAQVLRSLRTRDNRFDREQPRRGDRGVWADSERDAVRSQVRRILLHLLKLAHSPARDPRSDWMGSIIDARAEIENKLSLVAAARCRGTAGETLRPRPQAGRARLAEIPRRRGGAVLADGMPLYARPDPRRGLVPRTGRQYERRIQ